MHKLVIPVVLSLCKRRAGLRLHTSAQIVLVYCRKVCGLGTKPEFERDLSYTKLKNMHRNLGLKSPRI